MSMFEDKKQHWSSGDLWQTLFKLRSERDTLVASTRRAVTWGTRLCLCLATLGESLIYQLSLTCLSFDLLDNA